MRCQAVNAPGHQLAGAVEVVDGPSDHEQASVVQPADDALVQERVLTGDASGPGIAVNHGEKKVQLRLDVYRVKRIDFGKDVANSAKGAPLLRGGHDASLESRGADNSAD